MSYEEKEIDAAPLSDDGVGGYGFVVVVVVVVVVVCLF